MLSVLKFLLIGLRLKLHLVLLKRTGGITWVILNIPSRRMVGPWSFSFPLPWFETLVLNCYVHYSQDGLSSIVLLRDQTNGSCPGLCTSQHELHKPFLFVLPISSIRYGGRKLTNASWSKSSWTDTQPSSMWHIHTFQLLRWWWLSCLRPVGEEVSAGWRLGLEHMNH